nr:B3 domain-containing protein At5g60130-like isoform X1 [Ipomoea trifida]
MAMAVLRKTWPCSRFGTRATTMTVFHGRIPSSRSRSSSLDGLDPFGCEKIGMEGERARVVEVIRKESGDESLDIFVLEANICKRVKKYVKKEEGSDLDTCISVNKDVKKEEEI